MKNLKTRFFNSIRSLFKTPVIEEVFISLIKSRSLISPLAAKLVPNYYQYSPKSYRQIHRNGLSFKLDISEYINHLVYFDFKDVGFDDLLKHAIGKEVIFDVGANIGFTALNMAQNNNTSIVHAFEPDPYNFTRLKENMEANPNASIEIYNVGLGIKPAKLKLAVVTPNNLGGNRIVKNNVKGVAFNWIDVTTIDNFCEFKEITKIDLIKIDVEGFEMNVLRGGESIIKKNKPVLFIELDDNNLKLQNSSAQELIAFLEEIYPSIYDAATKRTVKSTDDFSNCHFDVIAQI